MGNNIFSLENKVAVISGASSGIGHELAKALAKAGARVALLARRKERLDALKAEIEKDGGTAMAIGCDVCVEEQVREAIAAVLAIYGHIDILVNNAGIAWEGSVENITLEDWNRVINTNLTAAYLLSHYAVPCMKDQKYGRIINIASVNALIGGKFQPRHHYNASKAGLVGLTIGMATSLGQYGITVNAIAPGLFKSEMTQDTLFAIPGYVEKYNMLCPLGRPGNTDEINGLVVFLASDASAYITAQLIAVDGGFTKI
ncbi:SDR family NAD(P)-dependent oxidoreductase [Porphyromonas pogonae]|uniref:SDR family NAD(P)-dependent oxidoreductase n=1 Tax=Porphyromonas pogonae TaxID=867595 RepID=UPI002E777513|nr:SDR family NAD(P)-dependent oxidoreductase [Porphyromonas pogonae]